MRAMNEHDILPTNICISSQGQYFAGVLELSRIVAVAVGAFDRHWLTCYEGTSIASIVQI